MAQKRKANWTDEEKEVLVAEYGKRRVIIKAAFSSTVTNKDKQKAWDEVTTAVQQANSTAGRDLKSVKKKWENLSSHAMQTISEYRKALQQTGGGPPPQEPSTLDRAIEEIIGTNSPVFGGISGGLDSSRDSPALSSLGQESTVNLDDLDLSFITSQATTPVQMSMSESAMPMTASLNSSTFSQPPPAEAAAVVPFTTATTPSPRSDPNTTSMTTSTLHRRLVLLDIERIKEEREKIKLEMEVLKLKKELLTRQLYNN